MRNLNFQKYQPMFSYWWSYNISHTQHLCITFAIFSLLLTSYKLISDEIYKLEYRAKLVIYVTNC